MHKKALIVFIFFMLFFACTAEEQLLPYLVPIPTGFPPLLPYPTSNEPTAERVELGRLLFFDPVLSRDSSISCTTCHLPEYAFSDTSALSKGIEGLVGKRNAPALLNVAYQKYLMRDGGIPNLEKQVMAPLTAHNEMDFDYSRAAQRLKKSASYRNLSVQAYNRLPDGFVISRALAAYQRTLLSTANNPYDRYLMGDTTNNATLDESAKRGLQIFEQSGCPNCHTGVLLTDNDFHNTGLYEQYADAGRHLVSIADTDIGKFKTPSLRNVSRTAPYMHDGSLPDLHAVVEHYASGGKNHPNKSPLLHVLPLNDAQKNDLVHFLMCLEDGK